MTTLTSFEESKEIRELLLKVHIGRECLKRFGKILSAHAIVFTVLVTVNLTGFQVPPKGWHSPNATMYTDSVWVNVFSFCNSLSLYSAISGLLMCVYCSYVTIVLLGSVPLPDITQGPSIVGRKWMRNILLALTDVALPSMRRRCFLLLGFLLTSLVLSVATYISAGLAAVAPPRRFVCVILPSIPGGAIILVLVYASAVKVFKELDIEVRFQTLCTFMETEHFDREDKQITDDENKALDPVPPIVAYFLRLISYVISIITNNNEHPQTEPPLCNIQG